MSLLSVVRDVCAVVGVEMPDSVFSGLSANRTMQEMLALANEVAQRVSYDAGRDWTAFHTLATVVGDGTTVSFVLPADYKRMLLNSKVRSSLQPTQPLTFISDYDQWVERRLSNTTEGSGEWIIAGGRITIWPALAVGVTAAYPYLNKNCVYLNSGGAGDVFMNDADTFRLPERLLKLGMIWQWKAQKGSPYAEDMGSFSDALAMEMGHDKPAPILIGGQPYPGVNTRIDPAGWTWPLSGSVVT